MEQLLDRLVRTGLRRGVFGSSQVWLVAGAAAFLVRRVQRQRRPHTVFLEDLGPGQAITITHHPAPE